MDLNLEIISGEIHYNESNTDLEDINKEILKINTNLEKYTSKANNVDYAYAVFSGIIAGVIDAVFIGDIAIDKEVGNVHESVNKFIHKYASIRGIDKERLNAVIAELEKNFKVAQDNTWSGAKIGVYSKNHHLADFAHHPTPIGLVSAIIVQFLRIGTFVNKNGEWHFKFVKTTAEDVLDILIPVVITGFLNWLVQVTEKYYKENNEEELPKGLHYICHLIASTPIIIEVVKCADNWFGHLVSDMGGSKNTAGGGMGIPGIGLSLLYELASTSVLKNTGLLSFLDNLYVKEKMDMRHEIALVKEIGKQAIPVVLLEGFIRTGYFITRLAEQYKSKDNDNSIDWNKVIPFNNRTIDRMLIVANMTFTVADTTDAAMHAALESGGNFVIFAGKFATRFNYIGAGRTTFAIVKEFSNEKKERQLIHEKMLLMNEKSNIMLEKLHEFEIRLQEMISKYLEEDIESFMQGINNINEGLLHNDSDLVINGNVIIQKVLGREPQFTNQKEFDELMDSDEAFIF